MKTLIVTTAIGVLSFMNTAYAQPNWHHTNHGNSTISYTNGWTGSSITYSTSSYGYQPYNYGTTVPSCYNSNYMKRAAKNSIRESAYAIRNAVQVSNWNDVYSPLIAKAIRHQQYAKTLYMQRNLAAAINHANRAAYLANQATDCITAMSDYGYIDNVYSYNDRDNDNGDYMNDASNYRQRNTVTSTQSESATTVASVNRKRSLHANVKPQVEESELDNQLPVSKVSDSELLKKIDVQRMLVE